MPEYTVFAFVSVVLFVSYDRWWLRSGIFRDSRYWIAMGICYAFMILVNGWFTKLSAPIVIYSPDQHLGPRVPWDIPVEDYVFGFTLLTAVLARWKAAGARTATTPGVDGAGVDGAGVDGNVGGTVGR